jgi:2-polyprenyl-3-methyl-5-hydroxy-6-metoxy-1,4-benzoquinol methylase
MRASARFLDPSHEGLELIRGCSAAISPDANLKGWYGRYSTSQAQRLAIDIDIVSAFVKPGAAVLEVGAVPLILTLALARHGFQVTAVDIDPSRFSEAITAHGLCVEPCNIETEALPFPDASFDALILNEVLEHLRVNPVFALREARRVLRPGGTLLLSTPNLRSLDGIWNLIVRGRSYAIANNVYDEYLKVERLGHMGHVREYAPGDVQPLLGRLGFSVDSLIFRNRQRKAVAEAICRARPELRRYLSYVARAV